MNEVKKKAGLPFLSHISLLRYSALRSGNHLSSNLSIYPFIYLCIYIPLCWVVYQFFRSNLAQWDMLGHFFASRNFRDSIFPYFVGWNSQHFAGYPQGYLYPSLFHWTVGGLAKIFPLEATFKSGVALSTLVMPIAIFSVFKSLYPQDLRKANYATLFSMLIYFVPKTPMGGDLFSSFRIGLVNENWAMVFFYFFLSALWKSNPSKKDDIKCGLLLGLTVLSHAIVGFVGLMVLAIDAFISLFHKKLNPLIFRYLLIGGCAFFIASAWIVPYLQYSSYGTGLGISFLSFGNLIGNEILTLGIGVILTGMILVFLIVQGRKKMTDLRPLLMAVGIIGFGLICECLYQFTSFDLQHGFPIHLYRFQYFILFFLGATLTDRISKNFEFIAIGLMFVLLAPFCAYFCVDSVTTDYNLGFRFPADSRVLVYQGASSLLTAVAPHQLSDSMQWDGIQTLNGLFAESSKHSRFYMSLENELFTSPMVWGVEPMVYSPRLAIKHLNVLGVSGVVSREPLNASVKNQLKLVSVNENLSIEAIHGKQMSFELFSAYLIRSPFAEWIHQVRGVDRNWDTEVYDWWMQEKPIGEILIKAPASVALGESNLNGKITASAVEKGQFSIDTHTEIPGWILVKESYFPNWKAKDKNGNFVPIYEASPHMMSVWGNGLISFEFSLSRLELLAQWCTLIFFVFGILIFMPRSLALFSLFFLVPMAQADTPMTFENLRSSQLMVGNYHNCNLFHQTATCWGINHDGQLGSRNHVSALKAQRVLPMPEKVQGGVVGSSFSCFYNEMEIWCTGRLGTFSSLTATPFFKSANSIHHLVASAMGMCAIFKNSVYPPKCFGKNEFSDLNAFHFPKNSTELQLGATQVCALANSELWCAGFNDRGQLGDGTVLSRGDFARVRFPKNKSDFKVTHFSLGADHTCAILRSGKVTELYCFGDNRFGQLGSRITESASFSKPRKIELPAHESPTGIALGDSHTCVNTAGPLYCFGDNSKLQVNPLSEVGTQHIVEAPMAVPLITQAEEVYAKGLGTCITKAEHYSCWGLVGNGI